MNKFANLVTLLFLVTLPAANAQNILIDSYSEQLKAGASCDPSTVSSGPTQPIAISSPSDFNQTQTASAAGPYESVNASAMLNTNWQYSGDSLAVYGAGGIQAQTTISGLPFNTLASAESDGYGTLIVSFSIYSPCLYSFSATCSSGQSDQNYAFTALYTSNTAVQIASFGHPPSEQAFTSGPNSGTTTGSLSSGEYSFLMTVSCNNRLTDNGSVTFSPSITGLAFSIQPIPEPSAGLLTALGLLPFLKRGKRAERC